MLVAPDCIAGKCTSNHQSSNCRLSCNQEPPAITCISLNLASAHNNDNNNSCAAAVQSVPLGLGLGFYELHRPNSSRKRGSFRDWFVRYRRERALESSGVLGLAMAVFTFVVKCTSGTWTAKQTGGQSSLEDSASNTWELQRKLTNLALTAAGSGVVSSSFSFVTPSSAVAQVSPSSFDRRDSFFCFFSGFSFAS